MRSVVAPRKQAGDTPIAPETGDTLWPLSQETGRAGIQAVAPVPWRLGSLGSSLLVGFAVGVAAAGALTAYRPRPASSPTSAQGSAQTANARTRQAAPPAAPAAASCPAASSAAVKPVAPKAPSPMAQRRWLLDRARSQQHQYRLGDAERLYRQVLAYAPRDSEALSGLGELELLRGTLDLADARFRQALAVNADYLPALVAVADIRWQSGQIEAARQAYQDIVSRYSADLYPPYVALRGAAVVAPAFDAERLP